MPKWCVHFVGVNMKKNMDSATINSMRSVGPFAAPGTPPWREKDHTTSRRQASIVNIAKRRVIEPSTECWNKVE